MSFLAAFLIRSLLWRIPGMRLFATAFGLVLALGVFLYIFYAMGLYRIGRNRAIPLSWLAWIPVASLYVLGAAADDRRGRRFFVILTPLLGGGAAVFGIIGLTGTPPDVFLAAAMILAAAAAVFIFMALYWVYAGLVRFPVPLLVLSVVFVFLAPIFLFALRERLPGGARRVTVPVKGD